MLQEDTRYVSGGLNEVLAKASVAINISVHYSWSIVKQTKGDSMEQDVKLALLLLGFNEEHTPSKEELAQSFRASSMKFHPDMGGSVELFRALTLARDIVQAHLPEPKKRKETHTEYTYYQSTEDKCKQLQKEIHHQARMAVINLSRMSRNIKELKLSTSFVNLTIKCHSMCEISDVLLSKGFVNNEDVLTMFKDALYWISKKPRKQYKQTAKYDLDGNKIEIKFSFKYGSFLDYLKP